ncbi:MAG: Beta-ketoacyl synthase, partial [Acidobacteria bacterium]|nr:Beta-ketoacyl synthase [Acidobacteriota bacterium]
MTALRRVVVTGLGMVSPHGSDPTAVFARLMKGESAIRTVSFAPEYDYSNIAAPAAFEPLRDFTGQPRVESLDRVSQLAVTAANAAVADAGVTFTDDLRRRSGVSFGTGMGSAAALEDTVRQVVERNPTRVRPLTVLKVMNNASAGHIAIQHGLRGPDLTYSSACASSAVAIGEAYRQIRHGYADLMVAGGAEAPLTHSMFRAWDAMHVLAPADPGDVSASCRPFANDRNGLVLGEGAAFLVLEEREAALRRGATVYAELAGYGSSNDSAHLTKPSVEGQAQAMSLALADAGLNPEDIDYVNAHGTATLLNDETETRALKQLFGASARGVAVSSTKSMHG